MTRAIEVIHSALEPLGAHSAPLNPAPPETINTALIALQDLIEEMLGEGFDVGADAPNAETDELHELPGARPCLQYGLMRKLAPVLRLEIPLSADLEARRVDRMARERWQYKMPQRKPRRKLQGQGNASVYPLTSR